MILGTGVLMWMSRERVVDRYGTVFLRDDDNEPVPMDTDELKGRLVTLYAIVKEPRKSEHIGDFFRGLFPSVPTAGERIEFGPGTMFIEDIHDVACVGVYPADRAQTTDWLDPRALYRCHSSVVELHAEPVIGRMRNVKK